ncbi:MAG: BCD family MFS transporter [Burkholderiaceae bacterium]|nr:BCD family MFS transporter [Burkholderiaceae bacterium]
MTNALGWLGIVRLGLVQTALGSIVVLTTSTMNRLMVVELALPAVVPGLLVGLHYALQLLRPRLGFGSDVGGRRTPWIVGGMVVLAAGAVLAALAIVVMGTHPLPGIALAALAFTAIGLGVGAAGTTLLVLLAKRVAPARRAAAAMVVWVMMIAGFIVTAAVVGRLLDPYSPARLLALAGAVASCAVFLTLVAVRGVERTPEPTAAAAARGTAPRTSFRAALREVWSEAQARRFAVFIFVSMLAFSAQDLILEPFAGLVFDYTPGESTRLSGVQNAGVLAGMVIVGLLAGRVGGALGSLRLWTLLGCVASAAALFGLTAAAVVGNGWPLAVNVAALGAANGAYAVAAIGSMMGIVGSGAAQREGVRMGIWGAAQAIAFGLGGFLGTLASDLARLLLDSAALAYGAVFALEGAGFLLAAVLAARLTPSGRGAAGGNVPALAMARE